MKRLYQAGGIVQRDALLARLRDAGIEAVSPARDVSRKMTENTVDLSLGGYSAMNQGFAVFVTDEDLAKAEDVLAQFLRESRLSAATEIDYWQKFYACALFSLTLPLVMNVFATYHFVKAVRTQGRPTRPIYFALASLCYVGSLVAVIFGLIAKGL